MSEVFQEDRDWYAHLNYDSIFDHLPGSLDSIPASVLGIGDSTGVRGFVYLSTSLMSLGSSLSRMIAGMLRGFIRSLLRSLFRR